jgi:site-specific DNA recombinase
MQGHWVNDVPYYRCRFPAEYAVANRVEHPLSVYLREDVVIGEVDGWLAREFAPHRMGETIRALVGAQTVDEPRSSGHEDTAAKIAECDQKLTSPVPRRSRRRGKPRHRRRVDRRDRSREGFPRTRNA